MAQESKYTPELGAEICDRLARGQSLLRATKEMGIPHATARNWEEDVPEHGTNSARARIQGCHTLAEECLDIADDGSNDWMECHGKDGESIGWKLNGEHVQRSKLRIDTRMRLIGKWASKIYGDKIAAEVTGANGGPIETMEHSELARRVAFMLTSAAIAQAKEKAKEKA